MTYSMSIPSSVNHNAASTAGADASAEARRSSYREEEREFQLALRLGVVLFLFVAIASRLMPKSWRPELFDGSSGRSVLGEARRAAHTLIPMAFLR